MIMVILELSYFLFTFFRCQMSKHLKNIWFSLFVLLPCLLACVYALWLSPAWLHFHMRQTCLAHSDLCFCQQLWFVCCHHLRMCVFTWLQVCVVTFDSEHRMIHSRWLPPSRGVWQPKKVKTENGRQDRKGRKNQGCDYHQTVSSVEEASIPILSAWFVT